MSTPRGFGPAGAPDGRVRRAAVIINPISGTGRRLDVARARAGLAAGLMTAHGVEGDVRVTEAPGHASALARDARAAGATVVVAWGGDGTINEVAASLAFGDTALAIVPSGSGNGLARELQVPFNPTEAFRVAFTGQERRLDAGELDGRLFFNVAGIGLDARIAHAFALGGARRGFARYVTVTLRELRAFVPDDYTVITDGTAFDVRAFLVAIANTRQYGNGAKVAPRARPDDGRLEVVALAYRSPLLALLQVPRLFTGTIDRVSGVTTRRAAAVEVRATRPMLYHVDGEPHRGGTVLAARVHPAALRVRVRGHTGV